MLEIKKNKIDHWEVSIGYRKQILKKEITRNERNKELQKCYRREKWNTSNLCLIINRSTMALRHVFYRIYISMTSMLTLLHILKRFHLAFAAIWAIKMNCATQDKEFRKKNIWNMYKYCVIVNHHHLIK